MRIASALLGSRQSGLSSCEFELSNMQNRGKDLTYLSNLTPRKFQLAQGCFEVLKPF